jgi:hypothetical protein
MHPVIADEEVTPVVQHQSAIRKGVWLDESPEKALTPEYFDKLIELELKSIAIMLDTARGPWDPQWTPAMIEKACKLAEPRRIELICTVWPYPNKAVLNAMFDDLKEWMQISPEVIRANEVDAEFNWKSNLVRDFDNLDVAGDYLVNKMIEVTEPTNARKELTTFTSHTENGRSADVAPHMDVLLVQAYSIRHRNRPGENDWKVPWRHTYGPGNMQKHTLDRTMLVPGVPEKVEMGCGLAGWDQNWPGHSPEEAMTMAWDSAIRQGCKEIRFWSTKWILGHLAHKTPYGAAFLRSLKGSA